MPIRFAAMLVLCLCLTLAAPHLAQAEELSPAKQADIRLLLQVSGSGAIGKQFGQTLMQHFFQVLRKSRPDIPEKSLAVVERETTALVVEKVDGAGGILDRLVPVYGNTYTHQEIRDMLAFYQSPTGQKSVAATPGLMREGQKIGEALSRELGPELKRRIAASLQQEGVVLDKLP